MMSERVLTVSTSPHIRSKQTVSSIMRDVIIALVPAGIAGVYYFGIDALLVMITAVISSVLSEYIFQKLAKKPIRINDLSAVVTGLLLAFNMPPSIPLWMVVVGSAFAIIVVKGLFGGIGQNIVNPALAGRAFLLAAYPSQMTSWIVDGNTGATPLGMLKQGIPFDQNILNAFLGSHIGGCIGEVSALALLIGFAYLLYRKVISWHVPVIYIITVLILTSIFGRNGIYEIFIGGLMLGAIFMATDYTTSPMTLKGKCIFAVCCGLLTSIIRVYGGYAEGVSYSILIMNLFVPVIDKYTKPRVFGGAK